MTSEERMSKAVEVISIVVTHIAASWLALHISDKRANWLIEHVESRGSGSDWKYPRWGEQA